MISPTAFGPEVRKCFTVGRGYLLCSSWVLVFNSGNLVVGYLIILESYGRRQDRGRRE